MRNNVFALLALCAIAPFASRAALPVVTNVTARQVIVTNTPSMTVETTKFVRITYNLFDDDADLLKIRVEISDNGGNLYSVPAFSFSGDIGENITTGVNKTITWDAGTDWDGEYSTQMVVKVIATDTIDFPGLAWGNEIPPSGFLMGQDGSSEGSGPARHVIIPWSYWLSRYEVQVHEYNTFLNIAWVAGDVYRNGNNVYANAFKFPGIPGDSLLTEIGDGKDLRWNVNNFEIVGSRSNFPVRVTWFGAMAFAHYYGYDLPTEAEWEKAARGPDYDDEDQHMAYMWDNLIDFSQANFYDSGDPYLYGGPTPVGYYDGNQTPIGTDMVNAYGLYDMVGNLTEWCRTGWESSIETYPQIEDLNAPANNINEVRERVLRGGSYDHDPYLIAAPRNGTEDFRALQNHKRWKADPASLVLGREGGSPPYLYETKGTAGFRVVRRDTGYQDGIATNLQTISFPPIGTQIVTNRLQLVASASSGLPVSFRVASGPGLLNGSELTFSAAGTVAVVATQPGDTNTFAALPVTNTFTVIKATAIITLGNLSQYYNGQPKSVTVITTPAGLESLVNVTYNGSSTAPSALGTYSVTGVLFTASFTGSATATLIIDQAPLLADNFDGSAWTASSSGSWTLTAASGIWSASYDTYRIRNSAYARSSTGCIGFTLGWSTLNMPQVSQDAARVVLWARGVNTTGIGPIEIYQDFGTSSSRIGYTTPSGTTYTRIVFDVSTATARKFFIRSYGVYIDDVEIFGDPP